jgi:hypothetical protein
MSNDVQKKMSSGIKDIYKGGASVDLVMTYVDSDIECYREIPYAIKEYLNTMREPPRPAIVLQSIQRYGARATLLAMREKEQIDGFNARASEALARRKAN